ncbi:unnamed protein product, partial [Rotaria magnacalcarata]
MDSNRTEPVTTTISSSS